MLEFLSQTNIPNLRDRLRQGWGDLWILTFLAKRIRCVWSKTAFSGIHTNCVKVFRSKFGASGVGGGGAGGGSPSIKILMWWKSGKKLLKSGQNTDLGKMCENLRKIASCALILQKWRPKSKCRRFYFLEVMFFQFFFWKVRGNLGKFEGNLGINGAWSGLIWKNAPELEQNAVIFLSLFSLEFFSGKFGEIWAKSFAPRCSYTYQKHLTAVTMKFYLINFTTMVSEAFLINYSQIFCTIECSALK